MKDTYLGDGVYASHQGDIITLDLRAQVPDCDISKIVLEPQVLRALVQYESDIMEEIHNRG